MKIEKLYYFLSVARNLNFTRAAQECHIAQPAISEQISSLEKELGVSLFVRGSRGIRMTTAGEVFYHKIAQFIENYENSIQEVRNEAGEKSLVIGIHNYSLSQMLALAVQRLRRRVSDVKVEFRTASAFSAQKMLIQDRCDLILTWAEEEQQDEEICREKLLTRRAVVLLSKNHPLAVLPVITREQLARERIIVPICSCGKDFSTSYLAQMKEIEIIIGKKILAQDMSSMFLMLESGVGITIAPQGAFQNSGQLVSRPIEGGGDFGSWCALYRKQPDNPLVESLLEIIREMERQDGN